MTPTRRSWRQPATTLAALTGILLAGAAGGSAPVDRPDPPGTTTEVRLGIFVMDVSAIDDERQTFTAGFWARASASPPPRSSR
jgi:hypothetical protein